MLVNMFAVDLEVKHSSVILQRLAHQQMQISVEGFAS